MRNKMFLWVVTVSLAFVSAVLPSIKVLANCDTVKCNEAHGVPNGLCHDEAVVFGACSSDPNDVLLNQAHKCDNKDLEVSYKSFSWKTEITYDPITHEERIMTYCCYNGTSYSPPVPSCDKNGTCGE